MGSVFGPVRFLLPICRLSWFLYTLNIYTLNICTFFVTFFSAAIDDTNLIFGHKLHIGMPYRGSDFGPVRFLLLVCRLSLFLYTLNIISKFFVTFFSATIDGTNLIFYHKLHIQCRYAILWEAISDPSGSYLLFADF